LRHEAGSASLRHWTEIYDRYQSALSLADALAAAWLPGSGAGGLAAALGTAINR